MWESLLAALPRGYSLDEDDWRRRHRLLLWLLGVHIPALEILGVALGHSAQLMAAAMVAPALCVLVGHLFRHHRRTASVIVTFGMVYCSTVLVAITGGAIEAHFHFFIIIGFIALYQDWIPFLFNILFVVISHGLGSAFDRTLIFDTVSGQNNPWLWSLIHGVAVLFACIGMMLFWRVTEDSQNEKDALSRQLAEAEIGRRQFTSDMLTNLARRNQSLLYRQLDIINQLEDSERDPDALAELFTLDHLATRVRRNAESLLVLSGEQPPRTWSEPVPLRDVLRAAIAETEDLDRVVFIVDERPAVAGHTVTDLTHLIAELTENAVRFSPPDTTVTLRARPGRSEPGSYVVTVEDWGVGMPPDDLASANTLLATPPEVDLSVSQRLGLHVVARLAARHGVKVSLGPTPGSGITAVLHLPAVLFAASDAPPAAPEAAPRHRVDRNRRNAVGGSGSALRAPSDRIADRNAADLFPTGPVTMSAGAAPADRRPGGPEQSDDRSYRASSAPGDAGPDGDAVTGTVDEVRVPAFAGGPLQPSDGRPDANWSGWWNADSELGQAGSRATAPGTHSMSDSAPAGLFNTTPETGPSSRPQPTPSPAASPVVPSPRPRGAAGGPPPPAPQVPSPRLGDAGTDGVSLVGGLRRRVPQSHLAAELREPTAPATPIPLAPTTVDAADALSRYQASRARAIADSDGEQR